MSPCSEQHLARGMMDEAALGWQVNGLFLSPEKLLSLAPPATAGLFLCASLTKPRVCFFVAGKSVGTMRLHHILLSWQSLFRWFGNFLFLYKHRAGCDAHISPQISHSSTPTALLIFIVVQCQLMGRKGSAYTRMLQVCCCKEETELN